jgi:hypothetical protein
MPPVFLSANRRDFYRPQLLDENELFCTIAPQDRPGEHAAPHGEYDAAAFLRTLPPPWNDPALLVVCYDHLQQSTPRNLATVKCPKVVLVGDTHHQAEPVRQVLRYLLSEPSDLVILEFNRQHVHFLWEAGIRQARWLPAFTVSPFEHTADKPRTRSVLFMGHAEHHPYRRHVLLDLQHRCPEYQMGSGTRQDVARLYSESHINLNISLNGDLNLRVFEVLAAGGFLLTDRLPPESGLEILFQEQRHLVTFGGTDQLLDQIRYYLAHPQAAQAIAAAGHEQYLRQHRPTHKIEDLMNLLAGRVRPEYDVRLDPRTALPPDTQDGLAVRLHLYEMIQEAHRVCVDNRLLFWSGLERAACDVLDLPRVQVTVVPSGAPGKPTALHAAGLDRRVTWLDRSAAQFRKDQWNIIFCNHADLQDPLYGRLMQSQASQTVGVVDTWKPASLRPVP